MMQPKRVKSLIQAVVNRMGYEIHKIPPVPPSNIRIIIGPFSDANHYREVSEEFMKLFRDLCNLKPNENVLDVGCGCGQMAVPLMGYLNGNARYEGFDIVPQLIEWCVKNISRKHPNFHLQLADVYNKSYNPNGQHRASEYIFPYNEESFDVVLVKSVFTHMLPTDMEHYFSEIARVSKRGSRFLMTFFLLNPESLELISAKKSSLDFKYECAGYRTIDISMPEGAVAYPESTIRSLYVKYRLNIVEPIHYGSWCGRINSLRYQDIIVAIKNDG